MVLKEKLPAMLSLPPLKFNKDEVNQAIDKLVYEKNSYYVEPRGIVKYLDRKPVRMVRIPLKAPEFRLILGGRRKIRRVIDVESFVGELKMLGAECSFEGYNDLDHVLHFTFWFNVSSNRSKACCSVSSAADGRSILLMLHATGLCPGVIYRVKLLDSAIAEMLERNRAPRWKRLHRIAIWRNRSHRT